MVLIQLGGCVPFDIPVKEPVAIAQQTNRSAEILTGQSQRDDVHLALGEPWLQSNYWGFDLYRVTGISRRLSAMFITIWPIPLGMSSDKEEGYVLIAYDHMKRVAKISHGRFLIGERPPWMFERMRAGRLIFGLEGKYVHTRPVLMADADFLEDYLASRHLPGSCTAILSCNVTAHTESMFSESACPDNVVVDSLRFNVRPFWALCERGEKTCPTGASDTDDSKVAVLIPVALQAGPHEVTMRNSFMAGTQEAKFECHADEVKYGTIHAWEDRTAPVMGIGRMHAEIVFEDKLPPEWKSRSFVLYREGRWLVEQEPQSP
jgi:hypothetical protein